MVAVQAATIEDTRTDPAWAKAMIDVLLKAKTAVAAAVTDGRDALEADLLAGFEDRYRQAALCGIAATPTPARAPAPRPAPWLSGCGTAVPSTSGT